MIYIIHSRASGNDNPTPYASGLAQAGAACASPNIPASFSSAARSRRGSTTYIPVGVDSGLRRNDEWGRIEKSSSKA